MVNAALLSEVFKIDIFRHFITFDCIELQPEIGVFFVLLVTLKEKPFKKDLASWLFTDELLAYVYH